MVKQLPLRMAVLKVRAARWQRSSPSCRDFLESLSEQHNLSHRVCPAQTFLEDSASLPCSLLLNFIIIFQEVTPKLKKRSSSSGAGGVDDFVPDGELDDDFFGEGEEEEEEEDDDDERCVCACMCVCVCVCACVCVCVCVCAYVSIG